MLTSSISLPDRVYGALTGDLRQGLFPPGSQLPTEPMLCERYGVSRTVLREAISRLKADGHVDVQQGRGTFVRAPSGATAFRFASGPGTSDDAARSVQELAELRLSVEVAAAGLAAQRRTETQLTELKASLDAMARAVDEGSSGSAADLAFHATIAQATGNGQYRMFMEYLRGSFAAAIEASRVRSASQKGFSHQAQREHHAIYEAIAARDARQAERAMRRHIVAASKRISADN